MSVCLRSCYNLQTDLGFRKQNYSKSYSKTPFSLVVTNTSGHKKKLLLDGAIIPRDYLLLTFWDNITWNKARLQTLVGAKKLKEDKF